MTDKPRQQQTLSLRINEGLRERLYRAKQLVASRTGEAVSTSDIAKRLLESAREDRLEVVDLMADPTRTLLQIRRKGEADLVLSKAEWTVLVYFVQQGLEAFSGDTPSRVSSESLIAVLDAFLAAYGVRRGPSRWDEYYLGNLPLDCRPPKAKGLEGTEKATMEIVRRTVTETRRCLGEPQTKHAPMLAGRNLNVLLEDEHLADTDALDRVLRPFWPALWRLAARGHYYLKQKPLREPIKITEEMFKPAIPPQTEAGFTLSFARGEGNDFSVLLSFPGPRALQYPIGDYPRLAEFRAMLAALDPEKARAQWKGEHFFGYQLDGEEGVEFSFRARENGITVTFSEKEWKAVRELFRRAWEVPDVRLAWDGLILEYGEL